MAGEFRELVIRLDMLATKKSRAQAEHTARQAGKRLDDPISFLSSSDRIYYLSDGGYSRFVADEDGRIRLTSNSREEVKAAWEAPEVRRVLADLSAMIVDAVADDFRPRTR